MGFRVLLDNASGPTHTTDMIGLVRIRRTRSLESRLTIYKPANKACSCSVRILFPSLCRYLARCLFMISTSPRATLYTRPLHCSVSQLLACGFGLRLLNGDALRTYHDTETTPIMGTSLGVTEQGARGACSNFRATKGESESLFSKLPCRLNIPETANPQLKPEAQTEMEKMFSPHTTVF